MMPKPVIWSGLQNFIGVCWPKGIYLAPSQFEACFISAAHTDEDIETTLEAARQVMAEI